MNRRKLSLPLFLMALFGPLQDWLLYYPERYEPEAVANLPAGTGLRPWPSPEAYRGFVAERPGATPAGTLAVFHGNAGSAAGRTYYRDRLAPLGLRVLLLEYPGYGARPGQPGEAALVDDGAESLRMILRQYGRPLYVLGESLGAAVAAGAIAGSRLRPDGLVLCTPWDDLATVARELYWFLPVKALLRDRYDSSAYLRSYDGPLAVIAAERDDLVPRAASEALFENYDGPKRLWVVPGGHNTWLGYTGTGWWRDVFRFLRGDPQG
jgi:pimeloyl-ACP methyl ester carboxylesterase